MERNVPKVFLDIIITWYDGIYCRVKWNDHYSDWFLVSAGVRQGGVLSPDFYSIYVDQLISILKSCGVGCYYLNRFAAALMYADDMAVLAPSLKGLQKLLSICEEYCIRWDIKLNPKKTKNICFSKGTQPNHNLVLDGAEIEWARKWVYLGVTLVSGPAFGCCTAETRSRFYRAANSVLRVEGQSDDMVMLRLVESHCISILTYAIEVIDIADPKQKGKMRVAYNSVFRKIFDYSWRESVTDLQHSLDRPTWEQLVKERTDGFMEKSRSLPESLVRACAAT